MKQCSICFTLRIAGGPQCRHLATIISTRDDLPADDVIRFTWGFSFSFFASLLLPFPVEEEEGEGEEVGELGELEEVEEEVHRKKLS